MPTVNIPARVRFVLYIVAALASLGVTYAVNKTWAGDAEVRLVQGLIALVNILAAAKTDLSQPPLEEVVADDVRAEYEGRHEAGESTLGIALLLLVVLLIVLVLTRLI